MRIGHSDHGCLSHLQCPFHDQVDDPLRLGILDSLTCSHRWLLCLRTCKTADTSALQLGVAFVFPIDPPLPCGKNCKLSVWRHRGASSSLMRLEDDNRS